jgi:hypothetical protein
MGPKRDEATGEWRKLHNEELHDFHYTTTTSTIGIIKSKMKWAEHLARMRGKRKENMLFVGMPEGKKPLGKTRRLGHVRSER